MAIVDETMNKVDNMDASQILHINNKEYNFLSHIEYLLIFSLAAFEGFKKIW